MSVLGKLLKWAYWGSDRIYYYDFCHDHTMHSTHRRGPSALIYYSSGVNQAAGTVGACWQISGTNLRGETSGFRLEGCRCVHSVSLIALMIGVVMCIYTFIVINTPPYVSYWMSLIYLLDSRFMTIMIAVNWYWILFYEYNELLQMGHFISGYMSQVAMDEPHGSLCQPLSSISSHIVPC